MKRQRIQSTSLKALGYDPFTTTLEVEFHDGDVYSYFMVPKEAFDALMAAPSKGSYFVRNIKPLYPSQKQSH